MAATRKPGSRPGLIHCDNCGEDYSASYRRCPFCDEYDGYGASDEPSNDSPGDSGGGKRLAQSNQRGGGYTRTSPWKVISRILSLAVILFAIWIVVTKVMPMVRRSSAVPPLDPDSSQSDPANPSSNPDSSPNVSPSPGSQPAVSPDVSPSVSPSTSPSVSPSASPSTSPSVTPSTSPSVTPAPGVATGFSLNKSDISISDDYPDPVTLKVTFTPAGASGTITWTSSNPGAVSVDQNGKVSAGSKRGSATITATLSNGVTQTCKVYNTITGSASPGSSPNPEPSSGTYTVNNPDFTLYRSGETYKLKVNNYTGGVSWSSSDTSIATVASDGTCTAVGTGKGRCIVTGTLDNGTTVMAIVRINIS